jgi:hypothetical protein
VEKKLLLLTNNEKEAGTKDKNTIFSREKMVFFVRPACT